MRARFGSERDGAALPGGEVELIGARMTIQQLTARIAELEAKYEPKPESNVVPIEGNATP